MTMRNITATNITEASFLLLNEIMMYGRIRQGENGNKSEDFKSLPVSMTIENPLCDTIYPAIPAIIPCSYEELADYIVDVVEDARGFEVNYGKWAYTYGAAIVKQLPFIIDELKRCGHTRRAVINISENKTQLEEPPCLQELIFEVDYRCVNMSVIFRSNDAIKAFPQNMTALAYLQKHVANELTKEIGVPYLTGSIYYFCPNVHLYENDWKAREENDWKSKASDYIQRYMNANTSEEINKLGITYEEFNEIYEERYPIYKQWCKEREEMLKEENKPTIKDIVEFLENLSNDIFKEPKE